MLSRNVNKMKLQEEQEKRLKERKRIHDQTNIYASELFNRGLNSVYIEKLYGNTLEEQDLPSVGDCEDITQDKEFQNGRARAELILKGLTYEEIKVLYEKNFLPNFKKKFETPKKHR